MTMKIYTLSRNLRESHYTLAVYSSLEKAEHARNALRSNREDWEKEGDGDDWDIHEYDLDADTNAKDNGKLVATARTSSEPGSSASEP